MHLLVVEQSSDLTEALRSQLGLDLITERGSLDFVSMAESLGVSAVLADLDFIGHERGIAETLDLREKAPLCAIVLVSEQPAFQTMKQLPTSFEYGFRTGWSYLFKRKPMDIELVMRALSVSSCGETVLDSAVLARVIPRDSEVLWPTRAREILSLADRGMGNTQIAKHLFMSLQAVEFFLYFAFVRLVNSGNT